mmetsp:Transcript_32954/g.55240  ORF Transcript_32954/g.55240 Transcript_32954/m.55240 type:complete len:86 (+) Transcript_32954:969-1226(+)
MRTKFYPGGLTLETQYQLMTYGITIQGLTITSTGSIKTKSHLQWLKNRRAIERARQENQEIAASWIEIPGINDVLFRKGGGNSQQ